MTDRTGKLIVISGPSGVGKSTIARAVEQRLNAVFSVSMTTRPPSGKDREGIDYYFVDHDRFRAAINGGELLEWAQVFDNFYGTPRVPVEEYLAAGRHVILEIDVNGAIQVRERMPGAVMVFVTPPEETDLLDRLRRRGREDEATIQRRFREAQREMTLARESGVYDHFVVNDDLDSAIDRTLELLAGEGVT